MRRGLIVRWFPAVFVMVVLAMYFRYAFMGQSFFVEDDGLGVFLPFLTFFQRSLLQGHVPLWNPYSFAGMSYIQFHNTAIFYPLNYLVAFCSPERYIVWTILVHLMWGGIGMWFLGLRWFRSAAAAAVCGLAFMLSPMMYQEFERYPIIQILAWAPWLMLCLDRCLDDVRWVPAAALCGSLQVAAGFPQTVQLVGLVVLVVFLFRCLAHERPGVAVGRLLAALALTLCLTAPVMSALLDLRHENIRTLANQDYYRVYDLSGSDMVEVVAPEIGGQQRMHYEIPLLLEALALLGLFDRDRDRRFLKWAALVLVVLGLLLPLASGTGAESIVGALVPMYLSLRYRARYLLLAWMGVMLLAGLGIRWLLERRPESRQWIAVGLLAGVALDIAPLAAGWSPASDVAIATEHAAYSLIPKNDHSFYRILTQPYLTRSYFNWSMVDGYSDLNGFNSVSSQLYQDVMSVAEFGRPATPVETQLLLNRNLIHLQVNPAAPILRLLSLKYILYTIIPHGSPKLKVVEGGVPHAWICSHLEVQPDTDAALARLNDPAFPPLTSVVVSHAMDSASETAASGCTVSEPDVNEVDIDAHWDGAHPAVLIDGDIYKDGWEATLDGQPVPLFRADLILRGLQFPPGRHRVVLRFHPFLLVWSPWITLAGLLACGWIARPRYN